jgi:hypothetical protein
MRSPRTDEDRLREFEDVPARGLEPWLLLTGIVALVGLAYLVGLWL